ncbi:hypothetical protein COOONC_21072 [Cooperia oncophora]
MHRYDDFLLRKGMLSVKNPSVGFACRNCLINVAQNVVKLSDFGLSKQAEKYNIPENEKLSLNWYVTRTTFTSLSQGFSLIQASSRGYLDQSLSKCDVVFMAYLFWEYP